MKSQNEPTTILGIESLRAQLNTTTPAAPTAQVIEEALAAIDATRQGLNALEQALRKLPTVLTVSPSPAKHPRPRLVTASPKPVKPAPTPQPTSAPSVRGHKAILDALAWWKMAGIHNPLRQQVAFIANYTVNGHVNNMIRELKSHGYLDYPDGNRLCLTSTGERYADFPTTPTTRQALHERVRAKLDGPQTRLFDVLLTYEGETITNEDLARRANYTLNGHFNNTRRELHALQIVEYVRGSTDTPGGTRLANWLYPAELPE